jgi:hypothetical protein
MNEEQTILLTDCKERKSYRRSFGSLDHCRVTKFIKTKATEHGIDENRLIIPTDGQLVTVLKSKQISTAQQLRVFAFKDE